MIISLEKGHAHAGFELPDNRIMATLTGRDVPTLDQEAVGTILEKGILRTAPQNLTDKRIAVIIPDNTRLWARGDLYVPKIVSALIRSGAAAENITIIIALGTHSPVPEKGFPQLCGKELPPGIRILNSAGLDQGRLVHIGDTPAGTPVTITREAWEADHIVIFGGVLHHMLAGFGGGRKYILPGIAGEAAIQQNHSLAMGSDGQALPGICQGELPENPVSLDMAAAAEIFLAEKTCCYAAVAANGEGRIFWAMAGLLEATFAAGCEALNHACCVDVDSSGDFALFSAGGHRTDGQLYQATKALFNAVNVVKEGGSLVFVAGCGEGVGNPEFAGALKRYKGNPNALGRELVKNFRMPAYVAFRVLDLLDRYQIYLVSDLAPSLVRDLGFRVLERSAPLESLLQGKGFIIPYAENILPRCRPQTP